MKLDGRYNLRHWTRRNKSNRARAVPRNRAGRSGGSRCGCQGGLGRFGRRRCPGESRGCFRPGGIHGGSCQRDDCRQILRWIWRRNILIWGRATSHKCQQYSEGEKISFHTKLSTSPMVHLYTIGLVRIKSRWLTSTDCILHCISWSDSAHKVQARSLNL